MAQATDSASQAPAVSSSEQLPRQGFFLLASLAFFWGTNWPAMKLAVIDMDPWTFRAICFIAGAGGLMLVARARGLSLRIPPADLKPLILTALINVTCWQIFSAFGLTLMAAGRASIIAFTMPLWASILSVVFLRERMTALRIVGLALGLAALAILLIPEFGRLGGTPWGAAMMLAAAICWAIGTVMLKAIPWRMDTIQLAAWQLAIGGVPVILAALLIGDPASVMDLTTPGALGVIYAALIPMIYCHWAWFRIVSLFPANVAAIGTLAIPVVGVFSSALILGEPLAGADLLALSLVVAGLFIVLVLPSLLPQRPKARTADPVSSRR